MTRICIALNTKNWEEARRTINLLRKEAEMFKVGLPLYLGRGKDEVTTLIRDGVKIFLDLKLNDIPSVVSLSLEDIPKVEILTVHGLGGYDMVKEAVRTRSDIKIAVVSLMTSISGDWALGVFKRGTKGLISNIARISSEAGAWGLVVPGSFAKYVRKNFKNLNLVVPGVRLERGKDEHKFTTGVLELKWLGEEDVIVLGREITESADPLEKLRRIKEQIG
jgi:orotidine 5''-phosphate decarboxylase, subfamily 1